MILLGPGQAHLGPDEIQLGIIHFQFGLDPELIAFFRHGQKPLGLGHRSGKPFDDFSGFLNRIDRFVGLKTMESSSLASSIFKVATSLLAWATFPWVRRPSKNGKVTIEPGRPVRDRRPGPAGYPDFANHTRPLNSEPGFVPALAMVTSSSAYPDPVFNSRQFRPIFPGRGQAVLKGGISGMGVKRVPWTSTSWSSRPKRNRNLSLGGADQVFGPDDLRPGIFHLHLGSQDIIIGSRTGLIFFPGLFQMTASLFQVLKGQVV